MPNRVTWVEKVPTVRIDGDSVMSVATSGDESWTTRCSRAMFRAYCERGIRMLNEADRKASVVVPIKRSG